MSNILKRKIENVKNYDLKLSSYPILFNTMKSFISLFEFIL